MERITKILITVCPTTIAVNCAKNGCAYADAEKDDGRLVRSL